MTTEVSSPIKGVALVAISVSNQEKAIHYYSEILGFEVTSDAQYGEGLRWVEVCPPGSNVTLALFEPFQDDHPDPGTTNNVHLETDDIERSYSELQQRGVEFEGPIMRAGSPVPPMVFFRDPDGNRFLLVESH